MTNRYKELEFDGAWPLGWLAFIEMPTNTELNLMAQEGEAYISCHLMDAETLERDTQW